MLSYSIKGRSSGGLVGSEAAAVVQVQNVDMVNDEDVKSEKRASLESSSSVFETLSRFLSSPFGERCLTAGLIARPMALLYHACSRGTPLHI